MEPSSTGPASLPAVLEDRLGAEVREGVRTLDGLGAMENLTTLYISNNQIGDWGELEKIAGLPNLKDVVFKGNPFWDEFEGENGPRVELLKCLPNLMKIDGILVTPGERAAAAE